MAVNKNKRVATKHIRDGIKSKYNKGSSCEICGCSDELELHHYHTVSLLLKNYAKENGIPISSDEEVLAMRDDFYKHHWHELVDDTVTLCHEHHVELHKIYSQEPPLSTVSKQKNWVIKRRDKINGLETSTSSSYYGLARFMVQTNGLSSFRVR